MSTLHQSKFVSILLEWQLAADGRNFRQFDRGASTALSCPQVQYGLAQGIIHRTAARVLKPPWILATAVNTDHIGLVFNRTRPE